jgi:hypothetical protein
MRLRSRASIGDRAQKNLAALQKKSARRFECKDQQRAL